MEEETDVLDTGVVVTGEGVAPGDDAAVANVGEVLHGEVAPEGGAEVVQAAEAAGMPQLDFSTFPNQIFWLVVTLVAIYLILTRVALPRIGSVLAERQGTITNDIAAAEDLRSRAADAEAAYEKALADARSDAQKISAEARAEINTEVEAAMARADAEIAALTAESEREIGAIRETALADVEIVAKDVARAIVSAFDTQADAGAVDAAVDAQLGGQAA